MTMQFEELDDNTRAYMLRAFREEEASSLPYRSKRLSENGLQAFPRLMARAIVNGNEATLDQALRGADLWKTSDLYGGPISTQYSSEQLARSEFNTWYVAGLAARLVHEGETRCEVYRVVSPGSNGGSCPAHAGIYMLKEIIAGDRARYWPPPGDQARLSIPATPGCHHTIRRNPSHLKNGQ